ncbi:MAG: DUF1800 domain-containing protein [Bauldia sp.]
MTTDIAAIALNRFGLGARSGDLARIASDPRGVLAAELRPEVALLTADDLPATGDALTALRQLQMERKQARASADPGQPAAPDAAAGATMMTDATDGGFTPASIYAAEIAARTDRACQADIGYVERLVAFWSNHFTVKAGAGETERTLVGAFEREAIRPHVLGRFADMLAAVTQHPAMLAYLDNETSIGPDSPAGRKRDRGLNENHARELMELHTIGVGAGYTQADVTSVADVLSGWSFSRGGNDKDPAGSFVFRASAHEPGPRTIMGKVYDQAGEKQGLALLADLAQSPATATHVATQLARSFVADQPPAALVASLAATFRTSGGDLLQLSRALVTNDQAWQGPGRFRTPQQFVWSAIRALGIQPKPAVVTHALGTLGQMPWDPPSPAGYDDTAATWLAPDAMTSRLDAAEQFAQLTDPTVEPASLYDDLFGVTASPVTREAVARAESQHQGLALLLMSPEFQRI